MSLFICVKTIVKVEIHLSEELEIDVGAHQDSDLLLQLFAIVIDVATNEINDDMLYETLYSDDLFFITKSLTEQRKNFYSWKSTHDTKCLKVNLMKTNVSKKGQINIKSSSKKDQR